MGTIADTARAVVDVLRDEGRAVGAVGITASDRSRRPPCRRALQRRVVAVVERTDEPAAADNPLTRETKAALSRRAPRTAR